MTGRSLLPILESGKSGRVEPDRDCIVTGLEWHGEFDPASGSCRSIRDDRHAYVLRYANVDEAGEPLETAALVKPVKVEFYDLDEDPWQLDDRSQDPALAEARDRLAERLRRIGTERGDPRFTAEMDLFRKTRAYVQKRKQLGYTESANLPFE